MPHTKKSLERVTPDEVLEHLKEGNKRFITAHTLDRDYYKKIKKYSKGQYPEAIVLNCIDSRTSAEIIFDQGIGDIFSVRIAGNILNNDILGSMEFACAVVGAKLILVLGHSNCGAIQGAISNMKMGNLTGLLDKIHPAVKAVSSYEGEKDSKNPEYMQKVADMNVIITRNRIRQESVILKEMEDSGKIKIAGGMYNLSTGEVEFYK